MAMMHFGQGRNIMAGQHPSFCLLWFIWEAVRTLRAW